MSVGFHVLVWLALPASLYTCLWAYGEWRRDSVTDE